MIGVPSLEVRLKRKVFSLEADDRGSNEGKESPRAME